MRDRHILRAKRRARIRAKVSGTPARPRLSVFRSHTRIYAQLIDDVAGITIASAMKKGKTKQVGKELGLAVAKAAQAKKITTAVFDRGGYRYHGVIAAIADGAREGGLHI